MKTQLFTEWEAQANIIVPGVDQNTLQQTMTHDQFNEYILSHSFVGVAHAERKEFLTTNGYEVTRESLLDHSLPAAPPPDKDTDGS